MYGWTWMDSRYSKTYIPLSHLLTFVQRRDLDFASYLTILRENNSLFIRMAFVTAISARRQPIKTKEEVVLSMPLSVYYLLETPPVFSFRMLPPSSFPPPLLPYFSPRSVKNEKKKTVEELVRGLNFREVIQQLEHKKSRCF